MALKENDFKRMIAFAAVAEIGYMILAIGSAFLAISSIDPVTNSMVLSQPGYMALKGGIFHILNDALDIGLLFLVAGAVFWICWEKNDGPSKAKKRIYFVLTLGVALIWTVGLGSLKLTQPNIRANAQNFARHTVEGAKPD